MYPPHDDESILSGIYTESGDASVAHNTLFDPDDDDEMFRRAVQAEQGRVMREFGVYPSNSDVTSVESSTDSSSEGKDKTASTPETYDEAYGAEDEESDGNDASTFHPNTFVPSTNNADNNDNTMKQPDPILTPRRLKMIMVALCVIFVASIAVAMGSFLAQKESESSATPQSAQVDADFNTDTDTDTDEQVPDTDPLTTTSPVNSPSASPSLHWKQGDECVDHPTQTFFVNERDGEQNCAFLRTNLDQRARLCLLEKEGYRWCPATCGLCLKPNIAPSISPTPGRLDGVSPTSSPLVETNPPTATPTTMIPTAKPTFVATEEPTPEPTAAETMPPTPAATIAPTAATTILATFAPTIGTNSSYFCRTCPFKICEILPCN